MRAEFVKTLPTLVQGLRIERFYSHRSVGSNVCADEKGNFVPGACYCMQIDFPPEMLLTTTFKEHDEKTEMTLRHMSVMADAHSKGWNQSLDKLGENLKEMSTREKLS